MSNPTQVAPATRPNHTILNKAIDVTSLGHSTLRDLGALFKAIRDTSDEYSSAHELANIGQYLADNWANMLDGERESLEQMREVQS